ncbi:hypothetical protein ACVWZM_004088 [Bradyrhizobium sp. USDA 4501]
MSDPHLSRDRSQGEQGHELTRRTILAGVAATTVTTGVVGVEIHAQAKVQPPTEAQPDDMRAFIYLSSALTGIAPGKLAPGFGVPPPTDPMKVNQGSDPVDIKHAYFDWLTKNAPKTFPALLKIAKDKVGAADRDAAIIQQVVAGEDTKYLGRSIVLIWYLGAWYAPADLKKAADNPGTRPDFAVISPDAYTQSWALSVAQAHPMGFSRFQFGYWSHPPREIKDFIG